MVMLLNFFPKQKLKLHLLFFPCVIPLPFPGSSSVMASGPITISSGVSKPAFMASEAEHVILTESHWSPNWFRDRHRWQNPGKSV